MHPHRQLRNLESAINTLPEAVAMRTLGPRPAFDSTVLEKLRYLRRVWARHLVALLVALGVALVVGLPTPLWIGLGLGTVAWLVGAAKLYVEFHRCQ